jgi:hypothetical protein
MFKIMVCGIKSLKKIIHVQCVTIPDSDRKRNIDILSFYLSAQQLLAILIKSTFCKGYALKQ